MARSLNGKYLVADMNDAEGAYVSASLPQVEFSSTDENQTVYNLFPYELNDVPIFTSNVYESSEPQIISEQSYVPGQDNLYYDSEGTVRVVAGSSFKLVASAQQPNVLNVENGIPIIKPANGELRYEWLVDGNLVFDVEPSFLDRRVDQRRSNDNVLEFVNVTKRMQGTYTCVVTNDIGQITSEDIAIEILDPTRTDDPFLPFNRKNIIQNGFALDSTNNWTAIIGELASKQMLSKDQETNAKRPNASVFGHMPGEIYPHPINIRTNSVIDFTPADLIKKNAAYFTRGPIEYIANGGTNQVAAYQDIDLSEITDYISGRAYGSKGVRAYFGCVLGNAITRFIPTIDIVGPDERNKEEFYFSNAPRISYENFVLAGPAHLEETVTVIVQEYEGETPLPSTIYENGEEKLVDNIQIVDKLSTLYKQTSQDPVQPPFPTVTTGEGDIVALNPITEGYAQVLNLYNSIYPSKQEHYAYGQYAEYQDYVISKLNTRTNKIRVTLRFDIATERMNEIAPDVISNDLFDLELWRKPYIKLLFKEYVNSVLSVFQQNQSSQYKDRPLNEQIRPGNASHAMATSLGLILEPITPTTQDISGFKGGLIEVVSKELEQRPKSDKDYLDYSGGIVIRDLTTGEVLINNTGAFGAATGVDAKTLNFKGMHIIRIEVSADSGANKDKVYPYLTIQLANVNYEYNGQTGVGNYVDVWPSNVDYNPTSINAFEGGRAGKNPRRDRNQNVKKFQIDIPSNQISAIYAGTRWWRGGEDTTENTVSTKIDFGPTGLVYFRV